MATRTTKEIVLITGGNTGLGFEIAKALLLLNRFHIIIGSRDATKGEAAVQKLHNLNLTDCSTIPLDITSLPSLTSAFDSIRQKHGRLDILHANAGIAPESYMSVDKTPVSELIKTACDTNVAGTAQSIETFIPLLQKSDNPRIIIMSTGLGSLTLQTTRDPRLWPAYAASKAALNMIMLVCYHQYPEMRINACAPAFRATALNNFGQGGSFVPGKIEDGANNAVRLSLLGKDGESGTFTEMDDQTGEVRVVPW